MSTVKTWRSAAAIQIALCAALIAAVFVGSYEVVSNSQDSASQAGDGGTGDEAGSETKGPAPTFTTADKGSCVTWNFSGSGEVTNFEQTDCGEEHRFEVASREDLSIYPTSEFGESAPRPDIERQAKLREELCHGAVLQYLDGQYDPSGRFSIAPILPPKTAWDEGDRTMLCGLQTTDQRGTPLETKGKVAEVDQANIAKPGECRYIDDNQVLHTVDCADPHQLETTQIVDLSAQFSDSYPADEDQNSFLEKTCTDAAIEYLGSEEALYQSTLQPYWGSISEASWNGGTSSVNCALMHPNDQAGFSEITGSARDGRDALLIDGQPPKEQPKRNPRREDAGASTPAPAPAPAQ